MVVRWLFCGGVVMFLWWCVGVFVVMVVWWCFCGGGAVVVLWWCGDVFVVVCWCFCGGGVVIFVVSGVVVFLRLVWWCFRGGVSCAFYTLLLLTLFKNFFYSTVFLCFRDIRRLVKFYPILHPSSIQHENA